MSAWSFIQLRKFVGNWFYFLLKMKNFECWTQRITLTIEFVNELRLFRLCLAVLKCVHSTMLVMENLLLQPSAQSFWFINIKLINHLTRKHFLNRFNTKPMNVIKFHVRLPNRIINNNFYLFLMFSILVPIKLFGYEYQYRLLCIRWEHQLIIANSAKYFKQLHVWHLNVINVNASESQELYSNFSRFVNVIKPATLMELKAENDFFV